MTTQTVYSIIPTILSDLGFTITFDGEYHAIDSDGVELKNFGTLRAAIEYIEDIYQDLLAAEAYLANFQD